MEKYRILSDIFAIPGLFCLFFGGLRWLAGQGAFRGVGYVLKNALRLLTFQTAKPYEPKENKGRETRPLQREKRDGACRGDDSSPAGRCGHRPLLVAGMICIALSGLLAGMFYL